MSVDRIRTLMYCDIFFLDILDFTLTDEEMAKIAELDKNQRYYHRTDEQLVQFAGWRPSFEKE